MDLSKLRSISNNYLDVRLISLREWRHAAEISPRDQGGPYIVVQEGYDPQDLTMSYDEFVLGRAGEWISTGLFLQLPREARREEFIFGTAAEVIQLLETLVGRCKVVSKPEQATALQGVDADLEDDLTEAFASAKAQPPAGH